MRRKRAHRMRVLEMPEDDLHVRIPVPIGKTVYRVHPNPACHYGVRAAGRRMFHTEYESCLPSEEEILAMRAAGYKCYMDGRVYPPKRGNAK